MQAKSDILGRMAAWVYRTGVRRRGVIGLCVVGLTVVGCVLALRIRMQEDVEVMLPDSDPAFVNSYKLLKAAPFTRNILIDLEATDPGELPLLTQTAEHLSERLTGPLIKRVIAGLPTELGLDLLEWLYMRMPQLFAEADAEALAPMITPGRVAETLEANLRALNGPEGLWLAKWLGRDPLGFRNHVYRKLGSVAMLPDVRVENGFVVDSTGLHTLLIAETPVAMGDSRVGEELLRYLDEAIAATVPPTIRARVVCAHRYTVANARAIKKDLVVVFAVSSLGLAAVFVVLLRHWRAVFVFAVPVLAILAGVLMTAGVFGRISAITVGFGAVLLGISVDYGLHVFFALRRRQSDPASCMSHLAVPMAVSCATTAGVFAVLLWAGVPIQRQLAVLSITGLLTALGLAVICLPHYVAAGPPGPRKPLPSLWLQKRHWVIAAWLVLLMACVPFCHRVRFDGDLRNVGMMPKDILADEFRIRDVWGDPRGRALVVARSGDVESTLEANEKVYTQLSGLWKPGELVSLAPLLPSRATQSTNLARWRRFWQDDGRLGKLRDTLETKGRALGYSRGAFEPFFAWLEQEREPFEPADIRRAAGPLLDPLFLGQGEGFGLLNLVPDTDRTVQSFSNSGLSLPPGVQAVSHKWFSAILRRSLERDFRRFLLSASAVVLLVLIVALRRVRHVILCLLPAATGLIAMLAVMGLLGMKVNMFNMAASVLVVGLSIDYGIFMVRRSARHGGAAEWAVATSALTTVSGFGALSLARHPAMFSLGITVVLGIIPAMVCALVVLPSLQRRQPVDRVEQ